MKRTLTMLLSVALIGSVVFAGSVAAFEIDQDLDVNQGAESNLAQDQTAVQVNDGYQGGNIALADDGSDASAGNSMDHTNVNVQDGDSDATNVATTDQEAENEFEIDLDF